MKKLPLSLKLMTLLFCSFLTVSCSKDDDAEPELDNQLEYNDQKYDLSLALTADLGVTGFGTTDTHYGQAFVLSDFNLMSGAGSVIMEMYLFSAGTTGFKTGTFEYANLNSSNAATQYANKNVFFESALAVDVNKDEEIDEDTEYFMMTGGTIKVSGTAPNFTIEADVDLENGEDLKARYTGEFTVVDAEEEEDLATAQRKLPGTTSPLRIKSLKGFSIKQ